MVGVSIDQWLIKRYPTGLHFARPVRGVVRTHATCVSVFTLCLSATFASQESRTFDVMMSVSQLSSSRVRKPRARSSILKLVQHEASQNFEGPVALLSYLH